MAKPAPSRVAAALDYLERLKSQAAEFGGGVVENLADRARSVGGLAYEALATDPNMGRMTTAEFSEAASRPTPRLDQAAQDLGTIGRAIVTQPLKTGQAIAQGEIDRAQEATTSPRAAGEYAGSFIDPMRIAAALRRTAPVLELDVYHGTPHRFPATEANPLGEFDASKIGTGEGAQAFGHGIYLAQKPEVAQDYQFMLSKIDPETVTYQGKPAQHWYDTAQVEQDRAHRLRDKTAIDRANAKLAYWENVMTRRHPEDVKRVANDPDDGWKTFADYANSLDMNKFGGVGEAGSLYKADLPDQMIDRMLDYDKPLSEQSAAVREALMPIVKAAMKKRGTPDRALEYSANRAIGGDIVKDLLVGNGVTRADVSRIMQQAGIPGIRYLDAGSRDGGSGTRNFVVFPGEEKRVRILERDGQKAPPQKIAQALEAVPQGGKVVGIRSRQTAKMANRINEALGGGPQSLSDNVQQEMKLATSVLQSKNPQAVEDWVQAYYNANLPMEQFEAATTNLRKTLPPETVDALIQNAGAFGTADQFKAFLNATPTERAKQLAKVSK